MGNNESDVVMYIIDKNYKILYQNEAAIQLHPEAQVGNICYEFYGGLNTPCSQCPINKKHSLMYNPHRGEWVDSQAAKMEIPEFGSCYAIQFQAKACFKDDNGEELEYENSFLRTRLADITDFVETQNKQKQELEEAMRKVEEANNAKTQFLSSMSHDIRTPMNTIVGMTTLAMNHIDDIEYVKNCLKKMSLASKHLLTLINDVLDMGKVESGKMTLTPIVFSLAETVSNLVNIVRQQVNGKSHRWDVRVHNIIQEYLYADELRLNQIFINILSNAVKYTPDGGKISVDFIEEQIEGRTDRIRLIYIVQDNGVGMSREFQKNMYNSFARARNTGFDSMQGTGLGLTISKSMIDLMGGTIACESELGEGTKFTVTLELSVAGRTMREMVLPPVEVLLVDDDEVFIESAKEIFGELGVALDCITNGEEAVAQVRRKYEERSIYSFIIVDWMMPGMSGGDTIGEIRRIVGEEAFILVTSAYDWADIEEEAKATGVNGFLGKPFFVSSIYESMVELLGLNAEKSKESGDLHENLSGMRILIAEDNDLNWEIAREILDMYHVTAIRAENGQVCVNKLKEAGDKEYDLILMDIRMPFMNGYEATKAIRNSEREYVRNIPIVAMTADAFSDDIQRCMEAGMNAHIAKPININNLLTILEDFNEQNAL